ncbi:MAG: hypothetical protein MJZ33_10775 [Paludibacteraceae bacterium]|nr:hypothetical protein [Paludibacteraceae bacterium]
MKKVRIFLATLFFIVVNVCTMQAVTNYPIQLTAQVLPPYGTCLSDYVVGGMERINITALQRDLTLSMYEINLQMQVKQGTKIILKSSAKYKLTPGIITKLPAAALFSALSDVDASTKYKENGFCFPEGAYEFVFQAYDARNSKLPVSEPVYFFAYLNKMQPPYCVFPADNECVDYSTQDINFVWVEPTVSMPTNNKRYALEIYEMPDGFDAVRDNAASMASTLTPIYNEEDINGITTMHPLHQAAGLFIKGRSYAWRVRTYSVKNRMVNSESKLYNTSDYVENNGYSKFSTFHFKKCVGQDDIWKKEDKKVLTCDLTLKPVIEKVDTANSKAVVVWKKEEDKFTCGYIVEWNLIDTLAAPWGQVKVPAGESQYELKNLKKGVKYITRVRGLVCPKSGSSDTIYSAYSDTLHFQLKKENESDCGHPVPGLSSTVSLKSALSNGSWITANGHDIKVLTCTMDVAGGDTTFTGTGLVSYGFLTNLVSLTVKFDKVKINEQNELMQGMVYCNTDKDNCLDFNLNGQANKKSAGSGPASLQESKLQTYDNASQMPNGSVGIVGDNVVVKDESGNTQEIGKEEKDEPGSCAPKTSCYDDQAAFVSFAPQEQWNPPFDAEQGIFTKSLSISDYYDKIERHTIPWIAMPAGEANKIYANLKIEPGSGVKPEDVYFICRSKNQTVRLKATQDGDSRFIVPIFGGEEGKCLEIVAMADTVKAGNAACSQLFTLGRAKVLSMKKETITLHIVPFRRDKSKVDGVSIENTLNTIYKPLGKTFKVEVEERFGDGEEYDFVEDGLSVEGTGFMKTETEEMSMLKSLYNMEIGFSEEDNQAYLFVLPKAGTDGVLGDMPRNKPVGYVFADPSSVYADGHTVAHEIGHGIFTFDHAFEYYSGDQGQTSNLMDYTQGGQNNDLKVWQWSVMDTHKNYVLPFLEGDEDGMVNVSKENTHYIVTSDNAIERDAQGKQIKDENNKNVKIEKGVEVVALSSGKKNQKIQTLPDKQEKYTSVENLTIINENKSPIIYYAYSEINNMVSELPLKLSSSKKFSIGSLIKYYADFTYNKITYYCIDKPNMDNYTGVWIEKKLDDFARKVCDLPVGDKRKVGIEDLKPSDFVTTPYGSTQYTGNAIDISKFTQGKEFEVIASCGKYYLVKGTRANQQTEKENYDNYEGAWICKDKLEFCVTKDDLTLIVKGNKKAEERVTQELVDIINKYCNSYEINTIQKMSHFLGQVIAENSLGIRVEEAYTTPRRIVQIFSDKSTVGHLFKKAIFDEANHTYSYVPINFKVNSCKDIKSDEKNWTYTGRDEIINAYASRKNVQKEITLDDGSKKSYYIYETRTDKTSENLDKGSDKDEDFVKKNYNEGILQVKTEYINSITLFDVVYACKNENGTISSKDGSLYRGRGYIQLTWKCNYDKLFLTPYRQVHKDDNRTDSELIQLIETDKDISMQACMAYFKTAVIHNGKFSKSPIDFSSTFVDSDDNIRKVSICVNGGLPNKKVEEILNYSERKKYSQRSYNILEK